MRTYTNATVTNGNVFGFGQDRVVSLRNVDTCAHAAQHLSSRSARERARGLASAPWRALAAAMATVARKAKPMGMAITGPQWQPVRRTSPALVIA
jgi:hypothetical protein